MLAITIIIGLPVLLALAGADLLVENTSPDDLTNMGVEYES